MKAYFADTAYYLALLNRRDQHHASALEQTSRLEGSILTTTWVLTELADGLSKPVHRDKAARFLRDVFADESVTVVPPSLELLQRGLQLFTDRADKEWSLTDCVSFVVMTENGLTEALTTDHHFEQAGFTILM